MGLVQAGQLTGLHSSLEEGRVGGPKAVGGRRTCRTEATAQTAHTSRSLQRSRLWGSSSVVEALRTEAAGRPMVAAPHRAAAVAEGVLRVAAAAARAARNLSRPLPQICSTAPVTTGGPPQRGLRITAVNAAVGQGGTGGGLVWTWAASSALLIFGAPGGPPPPSSAMKLAYSSSIVTRPLAAPLPRVGLKSAPLAAVLPHVAGSTPLSSSLSVPLICHACGRTPQAGTGGGVACAPIPRSLAPAQARASASPSV